MPLPESVTVYGEHRENRIHWAAMFESLGVRVHIDEVPDDLSVVIGVRTDRNTYAGERSVATLYNHLKRKV